MLWYRGNSGSQNGAALVMEEIETRYARSVEIRLRCARLVEVRACCA